ncbi:MAG: hypothetical protein R3D78_10130 [Paracoccaceae bacterium]
MRSQFFVYGFLGLIGIGFAVPGAGQRMLALIENPGLALAAFRSGGDAIVARDAAEQIGSPVDHLSFRNFAWHADDAVAATDVGMPVFLDEVFAGWQPSVRADAPQVAGRLPLKEDCDLARPVAGARVAMIDVSQSSMEIGLQSWNQESFRQAVADLIKVQRSTGSLRGTAKRYVDAGGRFEAVDVAITAQEVPVHLLLMGGKRGKLWNLHLAEGARLSGVTLLGGVGDALANLPADVPVEVLSRVAMGKCGGREAYSYDPEGFFYSNYRAGAVQQDEFERMNAERDAMAADWAAWRGAQYGIEPEGARIGYASGVAVLVGPLPAPEARVAWQPLAGASVQVADGAGEVLALIGDGLTGFEAAIEAKALELAGGSFETLRAYPRPALMLGGL